MKRSKWTCILSVLLISSMIVQPVSAAGRGSGGFRNNNRKNWFNVQQKIKQEEETTQEDESTSGESATVLTLVEDASTVENGEMLRASTYSLMTAEETGRATASETSTVKYFPVTMYDYDADTINAATDALDDDLTVREGLYFSDGSPKSIKSASKVDFSAFVEGQYYIQNIRAAANGVGSWLYSCPDDTTIRGTANKKDATIWTLKIENGKYYLISDGKYLVVGTNGDNDGLTDNKTAIEISEFSGKTGGVQLSQNGYYLCQWGSKNSIYYGGYDRSNDDGNGMLFYPVGSDAPITPVISNEEHISAGYEEWNRWDKASGNNANGDLIYTGLVEKELTDNQIVFNVNEGGIFNNDTKVKNIYEYVGLPFVLENGVYTFDSDVNGVRFADTNSDGFADPVSGTATAVNNLEFYKGNPQPMPTGLSVGDGSNNAWLPYNTAESYATEDVNYHFGMRADLPFSMTPNGRIKATDNESAPITFTFSGDDDVWVFIDGRLVVDLGGIHNRLDVTIDFAANTVTYSEANDADDNTTTGSYNDSAFATTQRLFTDDEGVGLVPMTRDAFALEEAHTMSVFYLERGEGTSNCQITFNLPMNDTVLVTKDATQSWASSAANNADEGVSPLTAAEQAIVNNLDFGFTLYKKEATATTFSRVANTNFYLLDSAGNVISIPATDANGHFYLKNGQTAKFITEIPEEGVTYYVVEDETPEGFVTPDFNFDGEAAGGYIYIDEEGNAGNVITGNQIPEQIIPHATTDGSTVENKSYEVTVKGSVEANDSVEFICSNFLDAELSNPTAITNEDIIVIDYGLPVQIDPLANDVFRGDSIEIVYVGGDDVTLTETTGADEIVSAAWTEDNSYDFGTVTLNDQNYAVSTDGTITRDTLTYTLNKQLTEVEELTYIIKVTGTRIQEQTGESLKQYDYAIGKIYIVPATSMYYEENFEGLVTFTGSGWNGLVTENIYVSDYQEPGVVGTVDDSTYGSDVAYLNDSKDSNGTHYLGDTTKGAIRFTYTFTGTGTSFFARTSKDTGYMQVKLYEGTDTSGEVINLTYRDTYYNDTNESSEDAAGILYNIPVYTEDDLHYGTYTVVATIAKAGTKGAGGTDGSGALFYLDGIRVMEPLNTLTGTNDVPLIGTEDLERALGAYATDGESNVEVVTLRQKLITDAEEDITPWNFVVLTDTNGEIKTAEEYTSIGPKEEVYLEKGQSISFAIKYWQTDGFKMYMGMKAPFGSGIVKVGQKTYNLSNATDCYFDITENPATVVTVTETDPETGESYSYQVATFTLTATEDIVSLTNIKVTGNYEFVIIEDTNIDVEGNEGFTEDENNEIVTE